MSAARGDKEIFRQFKDAFVKREVLCSSLFKGLIEGS